MYIFGCTGYIACTCCRCRYRYLRYLRSQNLRTTYVCTCIHINIYTYTVQWRHTCIHTYINAHSIHFGMHQYKRTTYYIHVYVYVCVDVCSYTYNRHTCNLCIQAVYIHICICRYIYIYICVCVCIRNNEGRDADTCIPPIELHTCNASIRNCPGFAGSFQHWGPKRPHKHKDPTF